MQKSMLKSMQSCLQVQSCENVPYNSVALWSSGDTIPVTFALFIIILREIVLLQSDFSFACQINNLRLLQPLTASRSSPSSEVLYVKVKVFVLFVNL